MSGLLCEPTSGERLLHVGRDKDAAFRVCRFGASVEANAGAIGDLHQYGQGAFEFGRLRDLHLVNQSRDEVVGVFEGVADVVETLDEEAGTLVDVMRGAVEFAGDGFVGGHVADKFIVHRSKRHMLKLNTSKKDTS